MCILFFGLKSFGAQENYSKEGKKPPSNEELFAMIKDLREEKEADKLSIAFLQQSVVNLNEEMKEKDETIAKLTIGMENLKDENNMIKSLEEKGYIVQGKTGMGLYLFLTSVGSVVPTKMLGNPKVCKQIYQIVSSFR